MNKNLQLYTRFFVDKNVEILDLFRKLKQAYSLESAIYPGSFVHITPSLVFQRTVYIDSDRRVGSFFNDPAVTSWVESNKEYSGESTIQGFQQNYANKLSVDVGTFSLLISQYAGFVSKDCKQYLKTDGMLLVNDSHGDAGLAFIDPDYELIAVGILDNGNWVIKETNLEDYFIPKKGQHPSKSSIMKTMKGTSYRKTAANYIFRKISES